MSTAKLDGDGEIFNLMPKSIEMTKFIIKNGDEEVEMEQMLIQSMANI